MEIDNSQAFPNCPDYTGIGLPSMLERKPLGKETQILAAGNLAENSEVVKARVVWARI